MSENVEKTDSIFAQNSWELEEDNSGRLQFGPKSVLIRNFVGECKVQVNVNTSAKETYAVGSERFRPDQLFKVTEIKQLSYFST